MTSDHEQHQDGKAPIPEPKGPSNTRRIAGLVSGVISFALILLVDAPQGMTPEAKRVAATVVLMGCWWIGESLPLGVTALVPLVAFPLLGIMSSKAIAPNYTNHFVFLLLGGFFIALAMQRWNLHTRIALWIIGLVGTSARLIVLGFMVASAFLSMWISNSATAMMMMPIGLGLVMKIEQMREGPADPKVKNFAVCLMLGIAYAANIGGVGTLVGTFPNVVFAGMFKELYPGGPDIGFVEWLKIGLPFTVTTIPLIWAFMVLGVLPIRGELVSSADQLIKEEKNKLGAMSRGEIMVLAVFVTTAILWITRGDVHLGDFTIRGWASRFAGLIGFDPSYIHDATVAMGMGILCFILPGSTKKRTPLLEWKQAKEAPWGILLLFGGGFAIAAGFTQSGLTQWVGTQLMFLKGVPVFVLIAAIVLLMTFLTEVTSNTATTTMLLPILAATAGALQINPLLLMLPATIAASCAFMLPIGTPPNAIVFASGRVSLTQMAKTGFWLNLITVAFITLFIYFWVVPVLGIDVNITPSWVN